MDEETRHMWETNRTRKTKPKSGLTWCGCDRNLVADGEKCILCGSRVKTKKFKKVG
jgi:hypothetical protein